MTIKKAVDSSPQKSIDPSTLRNISGYQYLASGSGGVTSDFDTLSLDTSSIGDGKILSYNSSGQTMEFIDLPAPPVIPDPVVPGGTNHQLQFNNNGVFAGAGLNHDSTSNTLSIPLGVSLTFGYGATLISASGSAYFSGFFYQPTLLAGGRGIIANTDPSAEGVFSIVDNTNTIVAGFDNIGGLKLLKISNSSAKNDTLFYSTTDNKVKYKHSDGSITDP